MQVVRVLFLSKHEKTLRELVDLTGLSPGGIQDALRRLRTEKIIKTKRKGNKLFCKLVISESEQEILGKIFSECASQEIKIRALKLSKNFESTIGWIDQTAQTYQQLKKVDNA